MLIKICGMRSGENIAQVFEPSLPAQNKPDYMGLIFVEKSPRFVRKLPSYLPPPEHVKRVGVFVDAPTTYLAQCIADYGLHALQLHGKESPAYCATLRQLFPQLILLKAFGIATTADLEQCKDYEGLCDYLLFDTACATHGGSGQQFDWAVLQDYTGKTPFLLSGGIGADDIQAVRNFSHPRCAGIDLNSRFEISPAQKDAALLHGFIAACRAT